MHLQWSTKKHAAFVATMFIARFGKQLRVLACEREQQERKDKYAVAVKKDGLA